MTIKVAFRYLVAFHIGAACVQYAGPEVAFIWVTTVFGLYVIFRLGYRAALSDENRGNPRWWFYE